MIKLLVRYLAWPVLLLTCCIVLAIGFHEDSAALYFNLSYLWLIAWVLLLERCYPYRSDWQRNDGQIFPDLGHSLINKGLVQVILIQFLSLDLIARHPDTAVGQLPIAVQVVLALVVSEFGLYWAHRLAHEWSWLWPFHAVHHSVKRLWFVNTGRFHFVDSNVSVIATIPLFLLAGVSLDAIIWVSAITAYIGMLTHCNIDVRCGPLGYVFNTPNLHRWHHAPDPNEGNTNYGENLMLWDMLFGTYRYRRTDIPEIGIREAMPDGLGGQLLVPFVWRRYQESESATLAGASGLAPETP